jgi:uncharacterized cupin superfamily protein
MNRIDGFDQEEIPMSVATRSGPKIDPAAAVAMALPEKEPFTQYDGSPLGTRGVELWASEDGSIGVGVWECDAGRFPADFSEYGEIIQVVRGELVCTSDADGAVTTLRPGDTMVFPRGWTGEWVMREPLRKIWTSWLAF